MLEGVAYCQMLFDQAGQPADWVYLEVNPAFEALTGLRRAAGKTVTQLIPGVREANPELFEIYGRVVRTGVAEQFETYLPALERWFLVKVYRPQAGHFAAVFENVTEARHDRDALKSSEALLRGSLDALADPFFVCRPVRDTGGAVVDFRISFANRATGAFLGRAPETLVDGPIPDRMPDLRGRPYLEAFRELVETSGSCTADGVEFFVPVPDGTEERRLVDLLVAPFRDGLFATWRDVTERRKLATERDLMAAAVEQTAESIMVTDVDGRITYVNPAFERVTGYARAEVIGQNPRILKSGLQSPSDYEAMWAALADGSPWVGDFVNRRKDGTFFSEEAVISPVRDAAGAITSYVAVQRDVTRERAIVERSTELYRERALILETIRGLTAGESAEATAQAICRQVASLTGIVASQLLLFESDGYAMPIGFVVAGQPDPPVQRLSHHRSRQLRGRASDGPWIEPWANRLEHPDDQLVKGVGVHSLAHAPISFDGQVIGLLSIQATDSIGHPSIAETLPSIVEFADLAGALLGREAAQRTEAGRTKANVLAIVAHRAFRPVFQPIVDLSTHAVVGYEALTRFSDLAEPGSVFAEAAAVGLGRELETATLKASLAAAETLPRSGWLNLNVSPDFITSGQPLRSLLRATRRRLVLEVTEHTAIADYAAFRAALAALGPKLQLAVDDAGAGFASLRHILELRPAFVKLDRWLVSGLEGDEARQAMIVGLIHFAQTTGCRLIAEGIETEGELAVVRSLGIRLGQGYLLGRPCPSTVTEGQPCDPGADVNPADRQSSSTALGGLPPSASS